MRNPISREEKSLIVQAPAKLNLFLEIVDRRRDGYHNIDTVTVPVSLFDTLCFERIESESVVEDLFFELNSRSPAGKDLNSLYPPEKNLVTRAARLLAEASAVKFPTKVTLTKRIPSEAGLGGGSSDAAATLIGLSQFWETGLSVQELLPLAEKLGSDVPLFLYPGFCRCTGRGEIVEPIESPFAKTPLHFVLCKPSFGLSTAAVYAESARQKLNSKSPLRSSEGFLHALRAGSFDTLGRELFNRLEAAALSLQPPLSRFFQAVQSAGNFPFVQMTGSGSCFYILCNNIQEAQVTAQILRQQGISEFLFVVQSC